MDTPSTVQTDLRDLFLIDPSVTFLNHGSFGACPLPVFESYQSWQRQLEFQPVLMLGREIDGLIDTAKQPLAAYLHTDADDLVFVPNATAGVNIIARSLVDAHLIQAGDEVLTTDHEYGACSRAWIHELGKVGGHYVQHPIPVPVSTPESFIEALWAGVTARTRVIYLSHITSATALIFPVEAVARRARAEGILTVIDGAHAPGQIPLDLTALDVDFYTGNLHKWLCAPKGAAFLHVQRKHQATMQPLYISWGWYEGATFAARMQIQGTRDSAAYLAVPDAIRFHTEHRWHDVRAASHKLLIEALTQINALTGFDSIAPLDSVWAWFGQMGLARLPACDVLRVKARLYDQHRVEIPVYEWEGNPYLRISIQGYNTKEDVARLIDALQIVLDQEAIVG